MFGIGIFELILVFSVALIVLGPNQLAQTAREIGSLYYRLKKAAHTAQTRMEEEFHAIESNQENEGKKQD